jgi:ribosomal-protein-alanine N-acetyltransferase
MTNTTLKLITPPCILDVVGAVDVPQVVRLYVEPEVRTFLGGPLSRHLAERRARELVVQSERGKAWAVRRSLDDPTLLGVVVLGQHHDLQDLEVSYLFLPEHWGSGYATGALAQVLTHAFGEAGLRRVVAETQSANTVSVRLLDRLGFLPSRTLVRFGAEQRIYIAESPRAHSGTER